MTPEDFLQVKRIAENAANAGAMVAIRFTRIALKLEKLGAWLTIDQAATVLETTPEAVKYAIGEGRLSAAKGNSRQVSAESVLLAGLNGIGRKDK